MGRIHYFEIHDQSWCPTILRDCSTDFIHFMATSVDAYSAVKEQLAELASKSENGTVIDLCSGGSGAIVQVKNHIEQGLGKEIKFYLSDLYPNLEAFEQAKKETGGKLDYISTPIDAFNVPDTLKGARTMFNAFHHFKPEQAKQILGDAVQKRVPIGIFESLDRSTLTFIGSIVFIPIMCILTLPFVRPFRWQRILFTLLLILPLIIWHDGLVSILRIYSPKEMEELTKNFPEYTWKWGIAKGKVKVSYLIGYPKEI